VAGERYHRLPHPALFHHLHEDGVCPILRIVVCTADNGPLNRLGRRIAAQFQPRHRRRACRGTRLLLDWRRPSSDTAVTFACPVTRCAGYLSSSLAACWCPQEWMPAPHTGTDCGDARADSGPGERSRLHVCRCRLDVVLSSGSAPSVTDGSTAIVVAVAVAAGTVCLGVSA
jgi:hypothetical protein